MHVLYGYVYIKGTGRRTLGANIMELFYDRVVVFGGLCQLLMHFFILNVILIIFTVFKTWFRKIKDIAVPQRFQRVPVLLPCKHGSSTGLVILIQW